MLILQENSVPPSTSKYSVRYFIDPCITGQCLDSRRFLQVHYHIGCAFNSHSIINSGLIPGDQNSSKRQRVFLWLWILWIKNTKILRWSIWKHRFLHGTCIQRGRNIESRSSNLLTRKDWNSIRRDRTPSSFTIHSPSIVSRKVWRWKLKKS